MAGGTDDVLRIHGYTAYQSLQQVGADSLKIDRRGQRAHEGLGPTPKVGHAFSGDSEDPGDQGDWQRDCNVLREVDRLA